MTWVRRHGAARRFRIVAFQHAPDPPMDAALRQRARRAVQVVTPEGRRLEAGRASLYVLERVGWGVGARVLAMPPLVWGVEIGYRVVARNRPFFERFASRPPARCRAEDEVPAGGG